MAWELIDNIRGPKGDRGDTGTIAGVSVTTLPAGAPATAAMTGPEASRSVAFGIPQGAEGKQGVPGTLSSASAESVAAGENAQVIMSGTTEVKHAHFRVPRGLPGSNAIENDAAVAEYLRAFDAESGIVLRESIQASTGLNALDYGAVRDGVADDIGALQAAANTAGTFGIRLIIPPGVYKTTATLNISGDVEAFGAQIVYYGSGTAIKVGKDAASISGKVFALPHVIHNPAQWNDGSVGIDVVNIYSSKITFNRVEKFDVGVQFRGLGRGCVYNSVVLGYMLDNRINLLLTQDETGWCNENDFIGGRFHHVETGSLGVSGSTTTHHIVLLRGSISLGGPNNNLFVKPSLEGNAVNPVRVVINDARYNTFLAARWETGGAIPGKIKYVGAAAFNRILGGYDLRLIQEDFSEIGAGATGGSIQDGQGSRILLRSNSAQSIPNATDTKVLWAPAGNTLLRVSYLDGVFTPRPGEWNVQVQIAFDANATGVRTARIKSSSGTVLAQTQVIPSSGARAYLYLSTRLSEPFYVEVNQSSGGALSTSSGSGNCTIMAEPASV